MSGTGRDEANIKTSKRGQLPMNQNSPQTVSTPGRALTPKTQQSAILDLKQKALEVIALTPEVRSEKVQVLKELVAKGSYRCNHRHLALNLIADHFLMTGRVPCQPVTGRQNPEAVIHAAVGGEGNPEKILSSK
jgi:anti-sigma28 factor (negative regulator of flagellin synthesis)